MDGAADFHGYAGRLDFGECDFLIVTHPSALRFQFNAEGTAIPKYEKVGKPRRGSTLYVAARVFRAAATERVECEERILGKRGFKERDHVALQRVLGPDRFRFLKLYRYCHVCPVDC